MSLSTTGYGTWSGGRFMHYGVPLSEEQIAALTRAAYEQGVRTFVTSDVYGSGKADELLGKSLQGIERASYQLVALIGHDIYAGQRAGAKGYQRFTDPSLRQPEQYAEYLQRATSRCLERCQTDYFDLVMLHNPDSIGYSHAKVWEGMQKLQVAGLTRQIGVAPGPANGFVLDLIHCFERFGEMLDWAMVILNPLEPWPQRHVLPVAKFHNIDVMTRVVDFGGLFHDVVKPGHHFRDGDHRSYRPAGWIEQAYPKIERLRAIAASHELTLLQLACYWNLAQPAVKNVIPTLIQEPGDAKSVESQLAELAAVTVAKALPLSGEELLEIERLGDNEGCMKLKGASSRHDPSEPPLADAWALRPELQDIAERFQLDPAW